MKFTKTKHKKLSTATRTRRPTTNHGNGSDTKAKTNQLKLPSNKYGLISSESNSLNKLLKSKNLTSGVNVIFVIILSIHSIRCYEFLIMPTIMFSLDGFFSCQSYLFRYQRYHLRNNYVLDYQSVQADVAALTLQPINISNLCSCSYSSII